MTTNEYINGSNNMDGHHFPKNYGNVIIGIILSATIADLNRIREYIDTNPAKWDLDSLYPSS